MAITDNTFTSAELIAALDANPAIVAELKTGLGSKKYVVQDETEHSAFLQNFKDNDYKKRIIDEHTSEFAPKLEKDIKDATGIDKVNGDEKYYDYFKRAISTKLGTVKQMETELEALKKGGNQSEADKIRIQQLEQGIQDKENEWKGKYEAKEKELNETKVGAVLEGSFVKVRAKYKAGLPESMTKLAEQTIYANVLPRVRFNAEKNVHFVIDDKGEPIVDKTTFLPKTVDAVILEQLGDMIDAGKVVIGTGTKTDDLNDPAKTGKWEGMPADVKTKLQLTQYLLKIGILDGSPEFDKLFAEHSKNLPLR